ncbi:MAG: L,D-transpeptidase family protein [Phycisphaerae bacterium]|nr:L,D-transpeptidase family protein [Phycisphaerae bacterium]
MPLPSQSARSASPGHVAMYRKSRLSLRPIGLVAVVVLLVVGVWLALRSPPARQIGSGEPTKPTASEPGRVTPSDGTPGAILATNPPISKPEPKRDPRQQPADPPTVAEAPKPQPEPTRTPEPAAVVPRGSETPSLGETPADPVVARVELSRRLASPALSAASAAAIRAELSAINEDLVFSPRVVPSDPYSAAYVVQANDSLVRIAQKEKLATDWRLIQRVNRMSNPHRLSVGQRLKLVRGPFHAMVSKSAYRLDLYMGPQDRPTDWVYVRSFNVGLGEGNSTPLGTFVVKANSKLIDPHWVNPRTGERFDSSDPKNPIGEHWIGLEGLGDASAFVGYGVHGTIDPGSIGRQMSMGCVRLSADDIALLYELLGERVSLVRIVP